MTRFVAACSWLIGLALWLLLMQLRYVDINGEEKAIAGDFTKLRHAPHLSPAALKVLSNTEARTRTVPGTHEVRKTMRYQTHSYRVPYGLACFFTFSPSERDSTIMLRMARARQSDPAINDDKRKAFYQRTLPPLDIDFLRLSPEALAEARLLCARNTVEDLTSVRINT